MGLFTVFGATGYIGQRLCQQLQQLGHQVATPSRGQIPKKNLGYVIYCIGLTNDYSRRPLDTVEAHVCFFTKLLSSSTFDSCTYLSSTRLYDALTSRQASETSPLYLDPMEPRHLYDLSKALGESIGINSGHDGFKVARLSCVYGGDLNTPGFIHETINAVKNGATRINTYGNISRDYIHIDDVCEGLIKIATSGKEKIYNLACGKNIKNQDIFDSILHSSGISISHNGVNKDIKPPPLISTNRLTKELEIRPRCLLSEIKHWI